MAEIGRKGGLAAHHRNAAFHHESAAHHHRQAARHHDDGDVEEGERQGEEARNQSKTAHGHSQKSRRAASQQKAGGAEGKDASGQDHGLESDLSTSDVDQQENLSRGDSDEVRTSGDEVEGSDIEEGGGRSNRQSGREDLHA